VSMALSQNRHIRNRRRLRGISFSHSPLPASNQSAKPNCLHPSDPVHPSARPQTHPSPSSFPLSHQPPSHCFVFLATPLARPDLGTSDPPRVRSCSLRQGKQGASSARSRESVQPIASLFRGKPRADSPPEPATIAPPSLLAVPQATEEGIMQIEVEDVDRLNVEHKTESAFSIFPSYPIPKLVSS